MSARSIAPNVAQALLHAFNPIRSDWQRHCVNQRSNTDWLSDAVSNRNRMHAHSPLDTTCEVENSAGETQTRCRCSGKKDQVPICSWLPASRSAQIAQGLLVL